MNRLLLKDEAFVVAGRLARYSGSGVLARALTPHDNIRVVLTHEVRDEHVDHFREIVRFIAARRRVMTPQEFLGCYDADAARRRSIEGKCVLFTFDDGLRSSYLVAKRVLEPLGITAAFFVPTGIFELEGDEEMRRFAWDRILRRVRPLGDLDPPEYVTMTRAEVLDLHRNGHAVFPHTHSHLLISEILSPDIVDAELRRPKETLEELLQAPCNAFAFPNGNERAASEYSLRQVADVYDYCFWALAGANSAETHPLLLHRDSIHPWHSLGYVRSILGGSYDAYHGLRQRRITRKVELPIPRAAMPLGRPPVGEAHDRRAFISSVAREFDAAGVEYVLLHGYERDHGDDSDVDVAISRSSLATVDALIRTGVFGRLLQCLHYASPWSRYYVVSSTEPERRYRQIDVVCDPWGIGKDGPAVPVALAHVTEVDGLRVPAPAAHTLYLAIKKARKHRSDDGVRALLLRAFDADPEGSSRLLGEVLGAEGRALAKALAAGAWSLDRELEGIRRRLRLRWRSPKRLAACAAFGSWRVTERVLRPTGLVLGLVGPDGAGKSTLAAALEPRSRGLFRRYAHRHLSPGLLPAPHRSSRGPSARPHDAPVVGPVESAARVLFLWADTLLGWLPRMRGPATRSTLVVLERGWPDLVVDPLRYRLSSPVRLAALLGRVLPRPALMLRLDAPVAVIAGRKAELDAGEVERQLGAWRRLAERDAGRFVSVDAGGDPEASLEQALAAIDDRLAGRQRDLSLSGLALDALGGLKVGGQPYRIIRAPRGPLPSGPRWLLPNRRGAPGPLGAQLFRPARRLHRAPALALEVVQRLGLRRVGTRVTVAGDNGVAPALAELLGLSSVELGAAVTGDPGRGARALLTVAHDGELVAFVKVAREQRDKLVHERRVLDLLAAADLHTLDVPRVLGLFDWQDCVFLVLEPFRPRSRVDRPLGTHELAGLAELTRLGGALAPGLGAGDGRVPVHGDFTPWNCCPTDGHLLLWDWEEARLGLPFEDLFYWRLQRLFRFGSGTIDDVIGAAVMPDADVLSFARLAGVSPAVAPDALRMCLEHMLGSWRGMAHAGSQWAAAVPILEATIEKLAAAGG